MEVRISMALSEQKNENTNMEVLARKIWDSNLKYRGKVIVAIEALLGWCGVASTLFSQEEGIQYELLLNGLYLLLVLISCEKWISRYLYLDNGKIGIGCEVQGLMGVMCFHAFDVEAYFALIKKSLWKLQIFHVLFWLLRCFCGSFLDTWTWQRGLAALATCIVALLCPYLLCLIKKQYYTYYLCHSRKTVFGTCLSVFGAITRFLADYFAMFVVFVGGTFLSFLLGAFLSTIFVAVPIGEEYIWRRSFFTVFYLFIGLVLMLIVLVWSIWGYTIIKKRRTAVMLFIAVSVIMLCLAAVEANRYIDFYDGRIVVRKLWKEKEYQQRDIAHYCISAEDDGIQMTLFMQDGEAIKLVRTSYENSDLYEEEYFGDYTYIADYVKQLEEQGIPGKLQDLKKLREDVKELNKEEQQGLERIVQQLGGLEGS